MPDLGCLHRCNMRHAICTSALYQTEIPKASNIRRLSESQAPLGGLAEGVGFEPTRGSAPTRSPGVRLKPLGHPSERTEHRGGAPARQRVAACAGMGAALASAAAHGGPPRAAPGAGRHGATDSQARPRRATRHGRVSTPRPDPAGTVTRRDGNRASPGRRARAAAHAMYWPPFAESVEPVMKPASSLARNTTQRATSSGSPRRPAGISGRIFDFSTSSGTARTISVPM